MKKAGFVAAFFVAETHPASEPDMRRLKASLNPKLYKQQHSGCDTQHRRHERHDERKL
jgi:hypothetical protein